MDITEIIKHYQSIKLDFISNSTRKNYFLSACFTLNNQINLELVNEDAVFGGLIGIGNSQLHKYLRSLKLFRLHAILHDAGGYMKSNYNVGPGYLYALPPAFTIVNSPFLGHITGLTYCLYLKLFTKYYSEILC